jgi:predicted DNA binding CopG/RHH family protein
MKRYLHPIVPAGTRITDFGIEFFKREAKKQSVPYQKMIRALVDGYAERVGK